MSSNTSRRELLWAAAGLAIGTAPLTAQGGPTTRPAGGTITEAARAVPIVENGDVVVCGAGPAGVVAAIAAARAGAKTSLIETCGCLGGTWTAGLLAWIIDAGNKKGVMAEITAGLEARGARAVRVKGRGDYAFDVEEMKLLLEEMCAAAGVRVRLHTRVAGVIRDGRRVTGILTESKSGREAWAAKAVVDCTGDGDVAGLAGCGFDLGRPGSGEMQPMSMGVLVTGLQFSQIEEFVGGGLSASKVKLLAEMKRAGVDPSYHGPTLFRIRDDLFQLATNHQYGVKSTSADDVTAATIGGRAEVHKIVAALRTLGGAWKDMRIVATTEHIGVREGRRVHGRYTVTADDIVNGVRHEDAVCRVTFGFDVHSTNPNQSKHVKNDAKGKPKHYDIPLRSLIAKDVDGLLMAGRCISGDFLAHSSYRVTGNAAAMGEAAGLTAARAAKSGKMPHEVEWRGVEG